MSNDQKALEVAAIIRDAVVDGETSGCPYFTRQSGKRYFCDDRHWQGDSGYSPICRCKELGKEIATYLAERAKEEKPVAWQRVSADGETTGWYRTKGVAEARCLKDGDYVRPLFLHPPALDPATVERIKRLLAAYDAATAEPLAALACHGEVALNILRDLVKDTPNVG